MLRHATALLLVGTFFACWSLPMLTRGDETQATKRVALAEQLIQKLGKPDARREWNGTALDYHLGGGNIFTITITDGEKIWAGLKSDLKENVGKRVTLPGVYSGPGKPATNRFLLYMG